MASDRLLRLFRPVTALCCVLAIVACDSGGPGGPGALQAAPLPTYGLGDAYWFSDGSTASVVAVGSDQIRWKTRSGTEITPRDVLLPRLDWAGATGSGQRRYTLGPVELFPLEAGKAIRFRAVRTDGHRRVVAQEDWRCEVPGAIQVATPAGGFDTWRVDCRMQETPAAAGNGIVQRTFYYSPDIGFYVRVEERVGDGPLRIAQLTRYTAADPILAESALRQRSAEIQRLLETRPSGTEVTWSDPASGASGRIALLNTRRSERFGWCRDFTEQIRWSGRLYALHGTGCRDSQTIWDIVMLAPGTIPGN
jgi:hypothetical protein